jgi:pimeloyl-ACP methyl ester carboxylesterase
MLPEHTEHYVEVRPGVEVFVRDFGAPDGSPVLFHHGTPSCSAAIPGGWGNLPAGVRMISFDRPGYGRSGNEPGRQVADAARWSERIADQLGLGRFALMGTSGGGPHAAAAAALLSDRVTSVCVSVGLGPVALPGFDVAAGMVDETAEEIHHARNGDRELRRFIKGLLNKEDPLGDWMAKLPTTDAEILGRPEVQAEEKVESQEVEAGGFEGWLEDDLALFHRSWDVDLAAVTADVLLLYGEADVLVPHSHGDAYREAIGHGQLVKVPGTGHWMRDVEPSVLRWLTLTTRGRFQ